MGGRDYLRVQTSNKLLSKFQSFGLDEILTDIASFIRELELRSDEERVVAYSRDPTAPTDDARFHLVHAGDEDGLVSGSPQILPVTRTDDDWQSSPHR